MLKKLLIVIAILAVMTGYYYRVSIKNLWSDLNKEKLPEAVEFELPSKIQPLATSTEPQKKKPIINTQTTTKPIITDNIPLTYNLKVAFATQAPFRNWNQPFEDACEEASAIIVDHYYKNQSFTQQIIKDEILKMIDWEIKRFGINKNLTAAETATILKEYLGYKKIEIIANPTINEIKKQISQQRPVIMPAAGRLLANPYFKNPGPIYHMLIIKGYTEDKFITNDPGTNTKGEDFLYKFDNLMTAMHEWNEADILQGSKKIIVVYPND
jgi:hypothetical protein